jgi:hypothetical protein
VVIDPEDPDAVRAEMARRNAAALDEALSELGTRLPDVARVLAALPLTKMSGAEVLGWWTAANGWLANRRPIDVLDDAPGKVQRAAVQLSEPSAL